MATGSHFLGLYHDFEGGRDSRECEGVCLDFSYIFILLGKGVDVLMLLLGTVVLNLPLLSLLFCPFLM
jgi:hypothetical protein